MDADRPFYCITGMHRSGTSLVARIAHLMGIDLGPEDRLMGPADDNPAGFWENWDVVRLDDAILHRLAATWDDPPAPPDGWEQDPGLDDLRAEAGRIVGETFGAGTGPAGWKDPRASLLLPFWRTLIRLERTILVLRDPSEVAASLRSRDGLSQERAAELWMAYVAAAALDGRDPVLVRYDDAVADPVSVARQLASELNLPEPSTEIRDEIAAAADADLRHHAGDATDLPVGPAMKLAGHTYRLILEGGLDAVVPFLGEFRRRRRADARVRTVEDDLADRDHLQTELRARLEALEGELDRQHEHVRELQGSVDRWCSEANRVERERAELEHQARELRSQREILVARAEHLEREANRVEIERRELERQVQEARRREEELRSSWSLRVGRLITMAGLRDRWRS